MSKKKKDKKRNPAKFRHAFAILLYRYNRKGNLEVFLAHENSPRYWSQAPAEHWGFPKGRADKGETPFQAATREFREEIGTRLPTGSYRFLMHHVRFHARRQVTVFTAETFDDVVFGGCEPVEREYPAKSGEIVLYNEILDARWFKGKKARKVMLPGQKAILRQLLKTVPVRKPVLV